MSPDQGSPGVAAEGQEREDALRRERPRGVTQREPEGDPRRAALTEYDSISRCKRERQRDRESADVAFGDPFPVSSISSAWFTPNLLVLALRPLGLNNPRMIRGGRLSTNRIRSQTRFREEVIRRCFLRRLPLFIYTFAVAPPPPSCRRPSETTSSRHFFTFIFHRLDYSGLL